MDHVFPTARIHALSIAGVVAARRGDVAEAFRLTGEAEAAAAATDCPVDQGEVALDRAEVLLVAGRAADARAAAVIALARHEHKGYAIGKRRARAFLASLPEGSA